MAERSFPFDTGSGVGFTEADWQRQATPWQDDGVVAEGPSSSALKVTSLNEEGLVYLEPGEATIRGFHYVNDDLLPVVVVPNTDQANSRADLVVLRLDTTANTITCQYKAGVAAPSPQPPALEQTATVTEIALARIVMAPGADSVPPGPPELVDARPFVGRRIRVSEDPVTQVGPAGTVAYKPSSGSLHLNAAGTAKQLVTADMLPQGGVPIIHSSQPKPPGNDGDLLFEWDTRRLFACVGASWSLVGPTEPLVGVKSKWTPTTRTTPGVLTDNTFGGFPLAEGVHHEFYARIIWTCNVTTPNVTTFRLGALPSGSVASFTAQVHNASGAVNSQIIANITTGITVTCESAGQNEVLILQGVIVPGGDGTLAMQWGPNTNFVQSTVQGGTYMRMTRAQESL